MDKVDSIHKLVGMFNRGIESIISKSQMAKSETMTHENFFLCIYWQTGHSRDKTSNLEDRLVEAFQTETKQKE